MGNQELIPIFKETADDVWRSDAPTSSLIRHKEYSANTPEGNRFPPLSEIKNLQGYFKKQSIKNESLINIKKTCQKYAKRGLYMQKYQEKCIFKKELEGRGP